MSASNGKLVTPDELAARWSVPRSQVYRLARDGRLEPVRLGRYVRFRRETIEEFERKGGVTAE